VEKEFPLILFLHGAGERGNNIEIVKRHGIAKIVEQKDNFPFITISPQCNLNSSWLQILPQLYELLNFIIENYKVDKRRIYLTGLSMGGFGTWHLAINYPELFAAIAPVCGGGNPEFAYKIKDTPIWAFHGDNDEIVPVSFSKEMVNELKNLGANVKFTIYQNTGHDSWTETYKNEELYKWFLSNSKNSF